MNEHTHDSPWKKPKPENGVVHQRAKTLYIMRGVPGSGKSTKARELLGDSTTGIILSTDDFFTLDTGTYEFDAKRLGDAHQWNQQRARKAITSGMSPVIIDNTHVCKWEALPYVLMALEHAYDVQVAEPETKWWKERDLQQLSIMNTHGVDPVTIERMLSRWETDFTIENIVQVEDPRQVPRQPTASAIERARQEGRRQAASEIAAKLRSMKLLTEEEILDATRVGHNPPNRGRTHRNGQSATGHDRRGDQRR